MVRNELRVGPRLSLSMGSTVKCPQALAAVTLALRQESSIYDIFAVKSTDVWFSCVKYTTIYTKYARCLFVETHSEKTAGYNI